MNLIFYLNKIYFFYFLFFSVSLFSQNGSSLDTSFGGNGVITFNSNFSPYSIGFFSDGKIIVASGSSKLLKLNLNGTIDNNFGTNGFVSLNANKSYALNLFNDNIYVGCIVDSVNFKKTIVYKYNNNGILDTAFGVSGQLNIRLGDYFECSAMTHQNDNKMVLVGTSKISGFMSFTVVRFDLSGNLDTTFGVNGVVNTPINNRPSIGLSIKIQNDEKITVGGQSQVFNNGSYESRFTVIRYNNNGSLDTMFGNNGVATIFNGSAYDHDIQSDGKIVIVGESNQSIMSIVRLNSIGEIDSLFGLNGIVSTMIETNNLNKIRVRGNKIIVAASCIINNNLDYVLAKYNLNGEPDLTFGINGKVTRSVFTDDVFCTFGLQNDGKIIIAGYSIEQSNDKMVLLRYYGDNLYLNQKICMVTYDSISNHNKIIWTKPLNEGIAYFKLWKESGSFGNYINIGYVPFDSLSEFTDTTSNPQAFSYKYKISVVDSNNHESPLSEYHRTMQLTVSPNSVGGGNNLVWTDYMIAGENYASHYTIYRGINNQQFHPVYFNVLPSGSGVTTMVDYINGAPKYYYKIGYTLSNSCIVSKQKESIVNYNEAFSNIFEVLMTENSESYLPLNVTVFPVLVNQEITIDLNSRKREEFEIIDILGNSLNKLIVHQKETFNISSLSSGIYIIKSVNNKLPFFKRIVKQ